MECFVSIDDSPDEWGFAMLSDGRHDIEPIERSLWRAVIKQSLIDATHPVDKRLDLDGPLVLAEAINFFTWATCLTTIKENFETVCEYAGLSATKVRATALRYITDGVPFRQRM
jgi:hypothetical protein